MRASVCAEQGSTRQGFIKCGVLLTAHPPPGTFDFEETIFSVTSLRGSTVSLITDQSMARQNREEVG